MSNSVATIGWCSNQVCLPHLHLDLHKGGCGVDQLRKHLLRSNLVGSIGEERRPRPIKEVVGQRLRSFGPRRAHLNRGKNFRDDQGGGQ
uniref:Uncharacterized protein n=1 Tax=Arundo donax TaxID=35708 RepID=A0A0A8YE82_ARUDO